MENIFISLFKISIMASCMGIIILFFNTILNKHTTATLRYYIWLFIIIRLGIPINFETNIGLANVFESSPSIVSNTNGLIVETIQMPLQNTYYVADGNVNDKNFGDGHINTDLSNETIIGMNLISIISAIWIFGMSLYVLLHFIVKYVFFRRVSKENIHCHADTKELFNKIKLEMGIQNDIPVIVSARVASPAIFSVMKPKLLLPNDIEFMLTDEELIYVLKHELIHYKRYDLWIFSFVNILRAVYWYNPLLWYLFKRVEENCEESCDEKILENLDSRQYCGYGMALVKVASIMPKRILPLTALSAGKSYIDTKRRITMVSNFKNKKMNKMTLFSMIITLAIVATAFFSIKPIQAETSDQKVETKSNFSETEQLDSSPTDNFSASVAISIGENGQIIIPKTETVNSIQSITQQDNYWDKQYVFTLADKYYEANYNIPNNDFVNSIDVKSDVNKTQVLVNCSKITAFETAEDEVNIYFTAKNPKDVYKSIIIIDPSHGGVDTGATMYYNDPSANISKTLKEKDLVLDLALAIENIANEISNSDIKVYLTRRNDLKNELSDSADFANQLGGVCINLHYNFAEIERESKGTESYYSSLNPQSKILAEALQSQLIQDLQTYDNKAKQNDLLYMLNNVTIPIADLEVAYLSNRQDLEMILSDGFAEKVALSVLNGVRKYYGIDGIITSMPIPKNVFNYVNEISANFDMSDYDLDEIRAEANREKENDGIIIDNDILLQQKMGNDIFQKAAEHFNISFQAAVDLFIEGTDIY